MFALLRSGTRRPTSPQARYSSLRPLLVLVALLLAGVAIPATAGASPNSAAAELCQQGGYENLVTATGQDFANAGECVSYAARGGALQPRASTARQICETAGGTYFEISDREAGPVWVCSGWLGFDEATRSALERVCDTYNVTYGPLPWHFEIDGDIADCNNY